MRLLAIFVLTLLVSVQQELRAADNDHFAMFARMVSQNRLISQECHKYFRVNKHGAEAAATVFQETAETSVSKDEFGKMLESEMQRRSKEFEVTGSRQWCLVQKAVATHYLPGGGFFASEEKIEPPVWSLSQAEHYLSLFRFFNKGCAAAIDFDRKWVDQQIKQIENGMRENSSENLHDSVDAEFKRRSDEIFATGPEQWCRYQESYIKSLKESGLFKTRRN
jgi:hypothetical protein